MAKGQKVTVTGNVQMREYTDKNGDKKTAMDVRVNDVALQGGGEQAPKAAPARQPQRPSSPQQAGGFEDFPDSDVPF
jgi:single-strand DNA-binding protein